MVEDTVRTVERLKQVKQDMDFLLKDPELGEAIRTYLTLKEEYEKISKQLRKDLKSSNLTEVRNLFQVQNMPVTVIGKTMVTYNPKSVLNTYEDIAKQYATTLFKVVNATIKHLEALGSIDSKKLDKEEKHSIVIKGL